MSISIQLKLLRLKYLFSSAFIADYIRDRKLRKQIIAGFKARRYVRFVSTIELGNFPHGVSDLHAVSPSGEVLHSDILFPEHQEDDLAVALSAIRGRKFKSEIGPVPNQLGNSMILQRVLTYTGSGTQPSSTKAVGGRFSISHIQYVFKNGVTTLRTYDVPNVKLKRLSLFANTK